MKFKIGDKVRVSKNVKLKKENYVGNEYTIGRINPNHRLTSEPHYGVKEACPYVFFEDELELATFNKIVITTDGKETLARLYDGNTVVKSAVAKCCPDDSFDFKTGATIAFGRLMGQEKVEEKAAYYNGKVVCVSKTEGFAYTVGKIYEFKEGKVKIDNEFIIPENARIKTLDEWNDNPSLYCKFIELVE